MNHRNESRKTATQIQTFIDDLCSHFVISYKNKQLSASRLAVMQYLIDEGPQPLSFLAKHRKVSNASMSCMMDSLASGGWVLRANSKLDKRSKIFIITQKGKELVHQENDQKIQDLIVVIDSLTAKEQSELLKSVNILKALIKEP